jgi:hypothetical protein
MNTNRPLGRMLVSKAKNRVIDIDIQKISLGSFFTTQSGWLTPQVRSFLENALKQSNGFVLDPFAGDGDLLEAIKQDQSLQGLVQNLSGFDLTGDWPKNDSLVEIPNPNQAVIVTNPPYLANHSAKRKGVDSIVQKYFEQSGRNNLYQIALDRALEASPFVVAIIPETFLLSSFPKNRLQLAVVIQDEIFGDTDAPALVACFGKESDQDGEIFKGEQRVGKLSEILALRNPKVSKKRKIVFNDPAGRIGLRAVDGSDGKSEIAFMPAKDFFYPAASVVVSSRLMTYIDMSELSDAEIAGVIEEANSLLSRIRKASEDLVLAPFKGNDKNGKRRRRIDYALARRILNLAAEKAIER